MKTILLPLNLDANTLPLFEYAQPVAGEMDASLLLLHVVTKQSYDNGTFDKNTDVYQRVVQEARMILDRFSRAAVSRGLHCRTLVLDGEPAETILDAARNHRAQMIVIARDDEDHSSVANRVLASSPCPVLTWSAGSRPHPTIVPRLSNMVRLPAFRPPFPQASLAAA